MVLTLALCVKCFYKHRFTYFSQTFYALNDHVPILPVRELELKDTQKTASTEDL